MAKSEGKKVSKGERQSVARSTIKSMRADRKEIDKIMNCLDAYIKGKKVKRYGFGDLPDYRFNKYKMKANG